MRFQETPLAGAFVVDAELHTDARGSFMRAYCHREFAAQGLDTELVQCNISHNVKKGILRGLHFQKPPHEEGKLVRCTAGSIFDVIVDIRADSPTYCKWFGLELSRQNNHALYIPHGFAHGFQTLEPHSDVFYQMTAYFEPDFQVGYRWNDPAFAIDWPLPNPILSDRDGGFPDFQR